MISFILNKLLSGAKYVGVHFRSILVVFFSCKLGLYFHLGGVSNVVYLAHKSKHY
jgi:hypothetical protein